MSKSKALLFYVLTFLSFACLQSQDLDENTPENPKKTRSGLSASLSVVPVSADEVFFDNNLYWGIALHRLKYEEKRWGWDYSYTYHQNRTFESRTFSGLGRSGNKVNIVEYQLERNSHSLSIGRNFRAFQRTFISGQVGLERHSNTVIYLRDGVLDVDFPKSSTSPVVHLRVIQEVEDFLFTFGVSLQDNSNGILALIVGVGYTW